VSNLTITAKYDSKDGLRNVREDLIGVGIESDRIYIDTKEWEVKVAISSTAEPEVTEILERHKPTTIYESKR